MCEKEGKIVFDGIEVATISCSSDGIHIKHTPEGKELCNKLHKEGCCQ